MQTDILLKQIHSSISELRTAIDKFEKHPSPSTQYSEDLYKALNDANKLVSAYLVIKERKELAPDLDIHLKLMNTPAHQEKQVIAEVEPVTEIKTVEPVKEEVKIVPEVKVEEVVKPVVLETNYSTETNHSVSHTPEIAVKKEYPKVAININDKFRFINELFNANATEYNIAIEQINTVNTLEEANAYLKGLKGIYQWDEEGEMVKKIVTLTQKRFS